MQQRIDRLEDVVTSLATHSQVHGKLDTNSLTGAQKEITTAQERIKPYTSSIDKGALDDSMHHGPGMMETNECHSIYSGQTHWGDVMHEVNTLS